MKINEAQKILNEHGYLVESKVATKEEEYALLKAEQEKRFKETYNPTSIFKFAAGFIIFCEV